MTDEIRYKDEQILKCVESYRSGQITRRDLLRSIIAVTGSYTAAHLFLETSGVAATLISPVEAQASNIDAETVRFPSTSGQFEIIGYLAKPKSSAQRPGVIVIHENRGLNEHIRDVARRFAVEGFVALAPDLLSRVGGTGRPRTGSGPAGVADESGRTAEEVTEAVAMLPLYGVIDDLKTTFDYLQKYPNVEPQKIASVGFCWGGWRSFTLATMQPKLSKAVVFYGSSPDSGFENIRASVLAHYAEWDNRITGNAIWTKKVMEQAGQKFQYYVYPRTDHAFFNDTGNRHNPEASKLAWQRTIEFLKS